MICVNIFTLQIRLCVSIYLYTCNISIPLLRALVSHTHTPPLWRCGFLFVRLFAYLFVCLWKFNEWFRSTTTNAIPIEPNDFQNRSKHTHTSNKEGKKSSREARKWANGWHIMASSIRIISFSVHKDYRFSYSELFDGVSPCSPFIHQCASTAKTATSTSLYIAIFAAFRHFIFRSHNGVERKLRRKISMFEHKQHVLIKIYLLISAARPPPHPSPHCQFHFPFWLSHSPSTTLLTASICYGI